MLVYNITFHIDDSVHEEVVDYLKNEYIPEAGRNGFLVQPRLCRIHPSHGEAGQSYAIQFYVKDRKTLDNWLYSQGEKLHRQIIIRFGDKVVGFSTLMEELDL